MLNYYRDTRARRSRNLPPMNDLTGSKKKKYWHSIEVEQAAFDETKAMLAQEVNMKLFRLWQTLCDAQRCKQFAIRRNDFTKVGNI